MSSQDSSLTDLQRSIVRALRHHWQLIVAWGVIMVILGVLAVIWPSVATIAVDIYIGWLLVIAGVAGLVLMFVSDDVPAFLWTLLTSALSLAAGILLLWKPSTGAASLTAVLTAYFIAEGIFQIAGAIYYRNVIPDSWGWMLASGIACLLLAALVIWGWPSTSDWVLGLYVGIDLITSGVALIMVAMRGRSLVDTLSPRASR